MFRFAGCGGRDYVPDNKNMGFGFRPYCRSCCRSHTLPLGKVPALSLVVGRSVRYHRCADFVTPDWSPTGKLVYAYVTYSLMMMIYSAINVPYASLLGVMSPNPKERNTLSTYRMTFAYIGSFIALLLFMPLVNFSVVTVRTWATSRPVGLWRLLL